MQSEEYNSQQDSASIFLMPSLYNETINMLLAARHYFGTILPYHEPEMSSVEKLHFSSEMSRITMRLTYIMSWLSAQRAIAAGELSKEEAKRDYPLEGAALCLDSNIEGESILPFEMRQLLEKSLSLYERVYRLDKIQQQI